MSTEIKSNRGVYVAWFVCTAFFFYQYMIRVFPNIISREIFNTFKVTAEEFSTLGLIYSLTYGIVQIPIGLLLDRSNMKRILLIAILFCIVGAMMFGIANDFHMMQISRFIIALGSGAALGITLKLISSNFIGITRSVLSGLTLTIGVIGPILGGKIIELILISHEWNVAVMIIGMSGFILFTMTIFFVKNVKLEIERSPSIFTQIRHVLSIPVLLYAIIAGGIYAPVCVFADMWGTRFLSAKFGVSETNGINISLSLYIGLAIGSLILPYFSEKIRRLNAVIILSLLFNAILFCILIFTDNISSEGLYSLVIGIGFLCGSEMICFNAAWQIVPPHSSALTVGIINSLSIVFNAFLQYAVGILMDMMWSGEISNGLRIYSKDDYIIGISLIPFTLMICFILSLYLVKKVRKNLI